MSNEIKLVAESRDEFGKGASRRIRRAGKVPAVLYGHGTDPVHITLPAHETLLALRTANALLALDLGGKKQLALPKQVQRDPIRGTLDHVDLILVRKGEKVTVEIQLVVVGELSESDLVLNQDQQTLALEVEATNIPTSIEVNIEGLGAGDRITVADLTLPEGASYHGVEAAEDNVIVSVVVAKDEVEETEAAEGEDAAAEDAE
ncbi:50S ribosomal protein L25/general stress protein Ctc [Propioniciclava tarda]|uniref:Large ribosomal subunit protein bL25 n=1 Tax=Propioniciclava tarda TaxID=433330 RepID=A0A4Q9KKT2_PROTD|nr:50S ribosomal protein L25/general stress protein Ctc [Propioniciclava tarda]TBT95058.1 50S ribosomal protein L25/general stress protein Ctc [Propioniciclava tarda]SMO54933.1 large subunit ribosomal protein L25 [Propioniciclava tarda]